MLCDVDSVPAIINVIQKGREPNMMMMIEKFSRIIASYSIYYRNCLFLYCFYFYQRSFLLLEIVIFLGIPCNHKAIT